jgi:uncharacterized protein (TIRG00374 family)
MSLPARRPARLDRLVPAILAAVFLFGLASLVLATGWRETLASIRQVAAWQVAVLLALSLLNYALRTLRWRVFTTALRLGTSIRQDLRHYMAGFAMTVTPGRIGELVRLRWIGRETGHGLDRTAPLMLMDRASDLAAIALLLALALGLGTGGRGTGGRGIDGAIAAAVLALAAALVLTRPALLERGAELGWRLTGIRPRLFARLRRAGAALRPFSQPSVLVPAIALGMVGWFAEGWSLHLLLGWMGHDIGLWPAVAVFVFATLTGGATGMPGGLGGAEAAMVALLSLQGVPLDISIPATAIIRLTTLWFAILIGMALFPMAERMARRAGADADGQGAGGTGHAVED